MEPKPHWLVDHEESDRREFEAIAKRDGELTETLKRIEEKMEPILEVYNGTAFVRKFLIGLGGLAMSITTIGAVLMWIWAHIKNP